MTDRLAHSRMNNNNFFEGSTPSFVKYFFAYKVSSSARKSSEEEVAIGPVICYDDWHAAYAVG